MDKAAIRREILTRRQTMGQEDYRLQSALLLRRLAACELYRSCSSLYCYLSFGREVPTNPILEMALADGKRIAAPRVEDGQIRFYWLKAPGDARPGFRGIPEPPEGAAQANDLTAPVLVPGLAFDHKGHRIGYGGGYYDRFLAREPEHPTIALCFDYQIFPGLPTESYDIPVDLVMTP